MLPTAHPTMNPTARIRIRITAREVVTVQARKVTLTFSMFWNTKISERIPSTIPRINRITAALLLHNYKSIPIDEVVPAVR